MFLRTAPSLVPPQQYPSRGQVREGPCWPLLFPLMPFLLAGVCCCNYMNDTFIMYCKPFKSTFLVVFFCLSSIYLCVWIRLETSGQKSQKSDHVVMTQTEQMDRVMDIIFILECCMGKPTNFVSFCRWANIYCCFALYEFVFIIGKVSTTTVECHIVGRLSRKMGTNIDYSTYLFIYLSEVAPEVGRGSHPGHTVWPAFPQVASVQSQHFLFWIETATSVVYEVTQLWSGMTFQIM